MATEVLLSVVRSGGTGLDSIRVIQDIVGCGAVEGSLKAPR